MIGVFAINVGLEVQKYLDKLRFVEPKIESNFL